MKYVAFYYHLPKDRLWAAGTVKINGIFTSRLSVDYVKLWCFCHFMWPHPCYLNEYRIRIFSGICFTIALYNPSNMHSMNIYPTCVWKQQGNWCELMLFVVLTQLWISISYFFYLILSSIFTSGFGIWISPIHLYVYSTILSRAVTTFSMLIHFLYGCHWCRIWHLTTEFCFRLFNWLRYGASNYPVCQTHFWKWLRNSPRSVGITLSNMILPWNN